MTSGAEFYFKGTRIRITFGFFAVWSVLIMQSPVSKAGELALLSCLLHEGGHITAMAVMGIKPRSLTFYSGGIGMKSGAILSPAREIFILSAGCLVNLLLALAGTLTGSRILTGINLALMLFNLLPLPSLDGGVSCARSWKQYPLPLTSRGCRTLLALLWGSQRRCFSLSQGA